MSTESLKSAKGFLNFVNACPTPYHVISNVKNTLQAAGFEELSERNHWPGKIQKGGKYYVTRNASSLIAFAVGAKYVPGNPFAMVGGHTDSPVLRIKPISKSKKEGYVQIGVETYGGGIWHTWFDRDLSIAGRVFVNIEGKLVSKLVKIDKPLLRIPTLAIHLTKDRYTKFEFNKETQFKPIAGLEGESKVEDKEEATSGCCKGEDLTPEQFQSVKDIVSRHDKQLLDLIAKDLDVEVSQIEDFELVLYDTQLSVLGGLNDEFIFSPRLDNQVTCYCSTEGLVRATKDLSQQEGIQLISLFDHEEIGSLSAQGADSSFLHDVVGRITALTLTPDVDLQGQPLPASYFQQSMAKSFMISSDMAHGVHPNYPEHYDSLNRPQLNQGPVIKVNANQRYVTNSAGIVLMKRIGNMCETPMQLFVTRNDSPCGSTIGPMISAKMGLRTLDLGNPQLSMHSIRETGGSLDVELLINLFDKFFEVYAVEEANVIV